MKEQKLWFKAKRYGWGWTPCSWEGWLVLAIWVGIFVTVIKDLKVNSIEYWLSIIISLTILIYICYKKGEKPHWSWGGSRDEVKK